MTTQYRTITGLIVAVCTPFNADHGIDEEQFVRHLTFLEHQGVQRFLIAGTTGEFFSLTVAEKQRLLTLARKTCTGLIMFNATCDSFSQTRELALFGQEQGADAITVLPPYYLANAPKQGIIDYLNLLADALSIPYILYNFPKHTQNPLTPDMLAAIRHAGIKDSSADISLIPHTPRYLIGSDLNIMKAYKAGACGYVTARGNVNPEPFVTMENALAENDMGKTEELQKKIATIASLFTGPQQIPMIKKALSEMLPGYPAAVRLPLKSLPVR